MLLLLMMMLLLLLLLLELTQWFRGTGGRGYDWSRLTYKYYRNAVLLHSLTRVVSYLFCRHLGATEALDQIAAAKRETCDV